MKYALILILSCAGLSLAQNPKPTPEPAVVKKLASVTWDLNTHKLVWVVQKGAVVNGTFVPSESKRYEVSPEEAYMASKEEKRDLGDEEASSLTDLVNLLSLYCAESTDWWEHGAATDETATPPSNDRNSAEPNNSEPGEKPTHVVVPEEKSTPAPRGSRTLVAQNTASGK
jgi:hypothetical protein